MLCNKITKPDFTKEQIVECTKCKYASAKVLWCGLFGVWIGEQKIIVPDKKIEYPSMRKMGKDFIKAGVKHLRSGRKERSEEECKRIRTICEACDKYVKESGRCLLCGCCMGRKIKWATTFCKLRKW